MPQLSWSAKMASWEKRFDFYLDTSDFIPTWEHSWCRFSLLGRNSCRRFLQFFLMEKLVIDMLDLSLIVSHSFTASSGVFPAMGSFL